MLIKAAERGAERYVELPLTYLDLETISKGHGQALIKLSTGHTISQRIRMLKKIPAELIPLGT